VLLPGSSLEECPAWHTGVKGPDEYHTAYSRTDLKAEGGFNNTAYINVMTAWVLDRARGVLDLLPKSHYASSASVLA
jgi:trehalose/maltose hydrolase-like predicted phosphorylase